MKSALNVPCVAGAELSVHACGLGDEEDAWRRQAHHKLSGVLNRSGVAPAWQKSWRAFHELFDRVAAQAGEHSDLIAERAVALGGIARGTLQAVAVSGQSQLRA